MANFYYGPNHTNRDALVLFFI